jgi:putative methanogenesis marker protein 8
MDKEAVKQTVEFKRQEFGFCCDHRSFSDSLVVSYGASEIIKTCMESGLFDCAVVVCEGAGTVMTSNSSLVQEIGAHLTGIIRTSPVKGITRHICDSGGLILDAETARINQTKGIEKAAEKGYKRIAVTVAGFQAKQITEIRQLEKNLGLGVTVFSVCNTCTTRSDMKHVANADIVTASASALIRKQIGPKALMQLGVTIPVFALTDEGKKTMLTYLSRFDQKIVAFRVNLPYIVETRGPRLKPKGLTKN